MMLTHCGNNVRNRYSGCVFSVKDIVPVPLKTSRNPVSLSSTPSGADIYMIPLSSGIKPTSETLSEKLLIGRKEAQKAQGKLEKNQFLRLDKVSQQAIV